MTPIKDEVDEYLKDLGEGSRELTSLKKFPTVLKVFRNKNTIQCSSGMSERLFTFGKRAFGDRRHLLNDQNFEQQILLNCNKKFYWT